MQNGMFSQPTIEGGNSPVAGETDAKLGGGESASIRVPVNGHSRSGLAVNLGVHENLIPEGANNYISCSAPEITGTSSECGGRAHKSSRQTEERHQPPHNNITKSCNQVNDSGPIVEIDEAPADDIMEDEDPMQIMFQFDRSPGGLGDKSLVRRPFARPHPLHVRGADEDIAPPEGLPERLGGGSIFRPIPARLPRSVSLSPCSSPIQGLSRSPSPAWSMSSLSPATARRMRGRNLSSTRNIDAILGSSPPVRIPRDPIQPLSGSISDVHSEASNDDEESDVFPLQPRQRSSTCPENRSFKRRVRMRNMRDRPPTPPPGGADEADAEKQLSRLVIKEKLHIHSRPLPEVPESPGGKFSHSTPNLFSD